MTDIKTIPLAVLLAVTLGRPGPASAQVVILVNPKSHQTVTVVNRQAPMATARADAARKGGEGWEPLLVSAVPGHGAIFCVSDIKRNVALRRFLTEGHDSGKKAIETAREAAWAYAREMKTTPYLCGTWNNQNKYPLDAVPVAKDVRP